MSAPTYQNLIAGKWLDADDGATRLVTDPATDAVLGTIPASGTADVTAAVDAAAEAFPEWAARPGPDRGRLLRGLFDAVVANEEQLATMIASESGKPLAEGRAEVRYGAGFLEWAAEEARRVYGETVPSSRTDQRILVLRQPIGVTAAITPWNFPLAMLTRKLGPALAVGCTQVIKPANETPLTAVLLCRLAEEVGIPAGVVNLVMGAGSVVGPALLGDPRVRKLSFTGSTEVGQDLVRMSAQHLTRLSLELGGHAPVIVLDDADVDVAVEQALRAKFRNNGQSCIAANRFYVARPIFEQFSTAFAEAVSKLAIGPWQREPDVGPLIDDSAVAKVSSHVEDAVKGGATLLCGGGLADVGDGAAARFFQPTVLANVSDSMLLSTEETFGPVAGLTPFDTDEEAIRRANDSPYGLAAYVFGRDYARVLRVVEALDYGVVGVNDGVPSTAQAPFGGMKMSGVGREGGHYVMEQYLETKYVSLALGTS